MIAGTGGVGVKPLPSVHNRSVVPGGCISCHMVKPGTEKPTETGGHTFRPSMEGCQQCHENPQEALKNTQEEITRQLAALKQRLDAAPNQRSTAYQNALKNYKWIATEKSQGFHNMRYTKALLEYSLQLSSEWSKLPSPR